MSSWASGLAGGAMIGISATLLLWSIGRVAGISDIVNGLATAASGDRAWRAAFLAGLLLAGGVALAWLPDAPQRVQTGATPLLLAAGLLVGFGTRMGNGCTSGHGVCGLGRLSPRSAAAVLAFMLAAMVTVYVVRHAAGEVA
ncbi:MAG: YeeE/YedE family protein [Gammaproteobacteria bacterium]